MNNFKQQIANDHGVGMRDQIKQWGRSWVGYHGTGMVFLISIFTALDPSPSQGRDIPDRIIFWSAHIGSGLLILILCQSVLAHTRLFRRKPAWVSIAAAGIMGALAFTPIALGLDQLFPDLDADPVDGSVGVLGMLGEEFAGFLVPFIGSWFLLNAPKLMESGKLAATTTQEDHAALVPISEPASTLSAAILDGFLDRVPPRLGRTIVALSAELHYLRVHTTLGEALILYSFGQAVIEMDGTDIAGMQIHRSHWVALKQVVALEKEGERLICVMPGSLRFPVSRPYRPALRAALRGLLE
ncbi:hypothetical protein CHU95_02745 [Niveispirillum lacus]|uniref:HTH LytTR-type domain-containing protein n=1 Tax=Niveispirillum lacus TaxID=1981099 RepID=A0A255Z662_9PROT|nr:LytTR family DNA-binding domain-containing protein [Niveispirillum lacus]OYQ36922.1 hypothetical protein CHU95_02745 [Niveispirillum lacus]